jgi:hypothetical protein
MLKRGLLLATMIFALALPGAWSRRASATGT